MRKGLEEIACSIMNESVSPQLWDLYKMFREPSIEEQVDEFIGFYYGEIEDIMNRNAREIYDEYFSDEPEAWDEQDGKISIDGEMLKRKIREDGGFMSYLIGMYHENKDRYNFVEQAPLLQINWQELDPMLRQRTWKVHSSPVTGIETFVGRPIHHDCNLYNFLYSISRGQMNGKYDVYRVKEKMYYDEFVYCYELDDQNMSKTSSYGWVNYIFRQNGIRFMHDGDDEYQTVVNQEEITEMFEIREIERGGVKQIFHKNGRVLFKFYYYSDLEEWLDNNYDQYKNVIDRHPKLKKNGQLDKK